MVALFDDPATFKNGDFIGVPGDGQSMCNGDGGVAGRQGSQVSQDRCLRLGIKH